MIIATRMRSRITMSASFHPAIVRSSRRVANYQADRVKNNCWPTRRLFCCRWLAHLSKLFQSIELHPEHAFYGGRNLLESAVDKSPDAVR